MEEEQCFREMDLLSGQNQREVKYKKDNTVEMKSREARRAYIFTFITSHNVH